MPIKKGKKNIGKIKGAMRVAGTPAEFAMEQHKRAMMRTQKGQKKLIHR